MGEEVRYEPPSPESLSAGHEVSDVKLRPILWSGVWLVVVAIVVQFALWGLMKFFELGQERTDPRPSPVRAFRQEPPEPRLQPLIGLHDTSPAQDWVLMKRQNDALLHSYGWVDRGRGIARIPIDEAMRLVAERGLPTTQKAKP